MTDQLRLLNETRGNVLVDDLQIAKSPWSKMKGLLGRERLDEDTGLLIEFCNSIHMFFMKFPIDVVYLDRNLIVENIVYELQPWGVSSHRRAAHVLEIAAGRAEARELKTSDRLKIEHLEN
jgi:uncharacterized membrane protein (UPF0127 family)